MNIKLAGSAAGAVVLVGCAPAPAASPDAAKAEMAECRQEAGEAFVGQKADAQAGAQLLAATGARQLRWVPPRTAVTMDYRPDRLTVTYDDDMIITQVSCT